MSPKMSDIRRHLQAYSALGASFLMTAPVANAAVVPTDPPDIPVGPGGNYVVDINNDTIGDVEISVVGSNVYGSPINGAALAGSGGATFCYPYQLSSGTLIGSSLNFTCSSGVTFHSLNYGSSSFGNWLGTPTSGYLAVQFDIGGATHYGWIHLELPTNDSVNVTAWAYDDVGDTPIQAGAIPVELQSFTIE